MNDTTDAQLRRLRWSVRAVMMLGILASLVANVLHAEPNPISRGIAAWPPLALLLTVELVSRIPVRAAWSSWLRRVATGVIAGIAAWISYWHMVAVAIRYGEHGHASEYLLPLTVDGLMVVASVCLVELTAEIMRRGTVTNEPTGSAEPAVELNETHRALIALVDRLGLDVDAVENVAWFYAPPDSTEEPVPFPWESVEPSADAPHSPAPIGA